MTQPAAASRPSSHEARDLFLRLWAKELPTTRKVLERIPEGSDYRPDPKSRTAREIAWLDTQIRKQKARRGGVFDDIPGAAHHDGGNTIGFEMTRHQH